MDKKDISILMMAIGAITFSVYLPGALLHWPLLSLLQGNPAVELALSALLLVGGVVMAVRLKLRWPKSRALWIGGCAVASLLLLAAVLRLAHVAVAGPLLLLTLFCAVPAWLVCFFFMLKSCNQ